MRANQTFGYVRVSTREQNELRQVIAMREYGVSHQNILVEKSSGKDFDRPVYLRLLKKLRPEDTLVVKSVDRLGRSYTEILEQWRCLTKEKRVHIVVLDMPLLNTRQGLDLTGTLISDIVLQLLSYVAQTERELIRQRQAEGIAAAKAQGIQFGRPPKKKPKDFEAVLLSWKKREISAREAAKQLGTSHSTFLLWAGNSGRS